MKKTARESREKIGRITVSRKKEGKKEKIRYATKKAREKQLMRLERAYDKDRDNKSEENKTASWETEKEKGEQEKQE